MANNKKKKLRSIWSSMKTRCSNKNRADYQRYGGRGIVVCNRWLKVDNFIEDMSSQYKVGLTLERKNNDAGYSPNNCFWATRKEQANNTRRNRKITWNGMTKTISQWIDYSGVKSSTFRQRFYVYGWNFGDCMSGGSFG